MICNDIRHLLNGLVLLKSKGIVVSLCQSCLNTSEFSGEFEVLQAVNCLECGTKVQNSLENLRDVSKQRYDKKVAYIGFTYSKIKNMYVLCRPHVSFV